MARPDSLSAFADPLDPCRPNEPRVDCGLLVVFGRVEIGEEVWAESQKTALEGPVEELKEQLATVHSVALRPTRDDGRPWPARGLPLVAEPMEPAFSVLPQALKASLCGRLVEPLPGPFDHDQRSLFGQRPLQPVDDCGGIGYVVKRGGGDHGVDALWQLELLELDAVVPGAVRRLRVDADGLVAARLDKWHEAAKIAAAEIDHPCRGLRQMTANERPDLGEPALLRRQRASQACRTSPRWRRRMPREGGATARASP